MSESTTLCDAFQKTAAARPEAVALRTVGGEVQITWREYSERVRRIAAGLAALGLGHGDTVALMMVNRPEFNVCDSACIHLGATPFSIYNTSAPDQIAYLLANARNRIVICEAQFAERINAARGGSAVEHVLCIDGAPQGTVSLADVEDRPVDGFDFEAAWRAVAADDVATRIYTSGTTGPPKGVELTHANLIAELHATTAVLPAGPGDRAISYLPAAHIADRWGSHYSSMCLGVEVTCIDDPRAIGVALADCRPTVWGGVPRIWEKLKAGLEAAIAANPDEQAKAAALAAIDCGRRKVAAEQDAAHGRGPGPSAELLDEFARHEEAVLSKLRALVGIDQLRWAVSGAAPTPVEVLEWFGAIGLPISELWGMSELSCCATINPTDRIKIGTVGTALPGVEVTLAEDGELLCRGEIVMRGYRGDPQKTAEAIDAEGWMHTGDIAEIDADGYVRIVDRKKELIINAAGKNMSPANIEARVKSSSGLIGQAVAIGDRRAYNVALIVLDPDACAVHAAQHGLADSSPAALASDPGVRDEVAAGVARANAQLSRVEQIKRFEILPTDWEPGGDELTPTMKLKRKPIAAKYEPEIERLYAPEPVEAG
jgi:long-subunit acyl-CoA synthetase (AMP-forming)